MIYFLLILTTVEVLVFKKLSSLKLGGVIDI